MVAQLHDWEYNARSWARGGMMLSESESSHILWTRELKKQQSVDLHYRIMENKFFCGSTGIVDAQNCRPYGIQLVLRLNIYKKNENKNPMGKRKYKIDQKLY